MVATTTKNTIQEQSSKGKKNELFSSKHHHYGFQDFFSFNRKEGKVLDWNNSRNIFVGESFIIGLMEGLEEEVGQASSVIMYNIGYEWGKRDAKFFDEWFPQEYGYENVSKLNLKYVLEAWWWPFISQGWGNWEVDMSEQKNGFMFINIFDSAIAKSLGDVGKPICNIYAGLFAGFFSSLVKKELGCIEIQCYGMGANYCKFLLGKQDRVNAATFWHEEGVTAKDIQKKLQNGEDQK